MVPAWHHVQCFFNRAGDEWKVSNHKCFEGWQLVSKDDLLIIRTHIAGDDPAKVAAMMAEVDAEDSALSGGMVNTSPTRIDVVAFRSCCTECTLKQRVLEGCVWRV